MRPAPHWYRDNRVPTDLRRLITVATPNPLVIAWRWRYEIALAAGLAASLAAAIISFGAVPTIVAVIVITLTILCWPTARQFAVDRVWCIITTHRVRVGCAEGLIYSSRGKIPIILWTSHQPFGERVLLWCRAGTSVDDFVSARAVLAAACWAQDVDIFFDIHNTHLVTLDVIRRTFGELISDVESLRSPEPPDGPHDCPVIKISDLDAPGQWRFDATPARTAHTRSPWSNERGHSGKQSNHASKASRLAPGELRALRVHQATALYGH